MPNWVKNVLSVENCNERRFNQICEFVKSENSPFDYNRIIPMPEDLDLEEGSANEFFKNLVLKYAGRYAVPALIDFDCGITSDELAKARRYIENPREPGTMSDLDIFHEALNLGHQYLENSERYGAETWYFWRSAHWGTKWNTLDDVIIPDGKMSWEFRSPWCPPLPVIRVLSQIFPEVRFVLQYADEDLGQNCGIVEYIDGVSTNFEFTSEEKAFDFACGLWDLDPDEERKERESWNSEDDDEDCFPGCDDDYPED